MKTIRNTLVVSTALFLMLLGDAPPDARFGFQLVPDAHAILGVWRRHARRWAVVGTAAVATTAAVAATDEAAAAEAQAADAQQQRLQRNSRPPPRPPPLRTASLCRWGPSCPASPEAVPPRRWAASSTTTAAATSIARCSRATAWST